jgi:hypothetical protein
MTGKFAMPKISVKKSTKLLFGDSYTKVIRKFRQDSEFIEINLRNVYREGMYWN